LTLEEDETEKRKARRRERKGSKPAPNDGVPRTESAGEVHPGPTVPDGRI
jgi:hypothetical protein